MALTDTAESRALRWLLGQATTAPVLPLTVHLVTALGDDDTPGTEVVGGGYTPQVLDVADEAAGQAANDTVIRWEGIPNPTTLVGVEIHDDAGIRWWHGPLAEPKTVTDGVFELAVGALAFALN